MPIRQSPMLPPTWLEGIESTMSASASASPRTPKWGRIGMRTFFNTPWFSWIVEWFTGTPG